MAEQPSNYHELPVPDNDAAGRNHNDRGQLSITKTADKWRPGDAPHTEPKVSTVARFAARLIDRLTGKAYTADQLEARAKPELVADAPVNAESATCLLNPSGSTENDILLTADTPGVAGNSLTAAIVVDDATDRTQLTVAQTGNDITITTGDKRRMIVSGTLTNTDTSSIDTPQDLVFAGIVGGKPMFSASGLTDATTDYLKWLPDAMPDPRWEIKLSTGYIRSSTTDSETPDGLTFSGGVGSGTATVTAATATAAQAIAAANTALTDVTASDGPSSDGTGAIAAVASTPFTGGEEATTSASGIQVTDTHAYFRTPSGTWKGIELDDLS